MEGVCWWPGAGWFAKELLPFRLDVFFIEVFSVCDGVTIKPIQFDMT